MKKLFFLAFTLWSVIMSAQSGFGVISAEDVNFRTMPDTKAELIKKIKLGTIAKVLEGPVLKGNNMKWYKLQIGSQSGWIAADFVFDLKPLTDIGPAKFGSEKYLPCVAVSAEAEMMGSKANFIVMVEGDKLSANAKTYPVKIASNVKDNVPSLQFYRNEYLSLEIMFHINEILYCDQLIDGTTTLAFSANHIYTGLYVFEIKPKLSEGVFEAVSKFSYNKHQED